MKENDFYSKHVGEVHGRLLIKSIIRKPKPHFICLCQCGNEKEIDVFSVLHGKTTSCGCYRKEKTSSLGKGNLRPAELIGETFTNSKGFEYKVVDKVYQALIKYEVEITD